MDFFFNESPDQLLGATELDIEMSPLLQDRIAQLCLLKIRQASAGRESLQRLAMLSCFWRRLQTKMLMMPIFTAPQVPMQLDPWITDFSSLDPSTTSLQGSPDVNWGLELLAPSLAGLSSDLDLFSLPQDLAGMSDLSFPYSPQSSVPDLPEASNTPQPQAMVTSAHLEQALIATVMDTPITDPSITVTREEQPVQTPIAAAGILAPPAELPSDLTEPDAGSMDVGTLSTEDQPLLPVDGDTQEIGMDVDIPIQDMHMTSPPPSRPKRRCSSPAPKRSSGQRRTRKPTRVLRSQRLAARLTAAVQDEDEDDDHAAAHDDDFEKVASRIKRRRNSEDSSSDSCPDSAPSSPRTPPSTFEGPATPSTDHALTSEALYLADSIAAQEVSPNDTSIDAQGPRSQLAAVSSLDKGPYLAVAVEALVNLKHMEDDASPHGRYPSRRPSTRPFGRF
ncbi:hypothetical protein BGX34_007400 [Mortierella sp. NVP85]|nr:hypothetical protein BGX34_007400 [Mortierella sp. NVP85]